jgi:hypothetical protein
MTFQITYDPDYKRTMFAVTVENRANIPAIKDQIGSVIKQYVDGETAKVTENVIPYKVETSDNGVVAAFFTVQVTNMGQNAVKLQQVICPVFQPFMSDINNSVNLFIQNGGFRNDILV